MDLLCAADLLAICEKRNLTVPEVVWDYEVERSGDSRELVWQTMAERLAVMRAAVAEGIADPGTLAHLAKGYGAKMAAAPEGKFAGQTQLRRITTVALAVAQHNAALGRVVACPTAGSCGVLPAALLAAVEDRNFSDDKLIRALFTAAGVGTVSAAQGPISGSEGGCQAECGVASAMAAGALIYLLGGSSRQIFEAASLAMQNLLGLVCDPVAGLVEVPCITRNAAAAANAVMCADMVLAGIPAVIPFDETVRAMKQVGKAMPETLRETSRGGLAVTPTGLKLHRQLQKEHRLEAE